MKNTVTTILLLFIYSMLCGFAPPSPQTSANLTKEINKLISQSNEDLTIGIVVANANTGEIIYQKNANHYFTPASTLKVVTASVAYDLLGPDYRFTTTLYGDKCKVRENVLCDNLYLKFSGDPTLTTNDLNMMLLQLKNLGISHVNGNLVIDDSEDNNLSNSLPPGVCYEDKKFCFGAPVSSLIINQNCISATLCPTKHKQKTSLKFLNTHQPTVTNTVLTNKKLPDHAELEAHENNNYLISGNINEPLNLKIAVQNQRLYAKETLKHLLATHQITVHKILFGKTKQACPLIQHESESLVFLMTSMLKSSDNIISNAVFKKLSGTEKMATNWENAAFIVKKYLSDRLKIDSEKIIIQDGAGLSRYNLVTPNQLVKILNDVNHHTNKFVFFNNALPISGIDGTLKNRMVDIIGKIRAKTGTENAISSLAGFIEKPNHPLLTFAIMINAGIGPIQKYRDLEDNICRLVINSQS